eukprot:COSAG05_NODE_977_length_6332_cov_10.027755_4_plen_261_part_00
MELGQAPSGFVDGSEAAHAQALAQAQAQAQAQQLVDGSTALKDRLGSRRGGKAKKKKKKKRQQAAAASAVRSPTHPLTLACMQSRARMRLKGLLTLIRTCGAHLSLCGSALIRDCSHLFSTHTLACGLMVMVVLMTMVAAVQVPTRPLTEAELAAKAEEERVAKIRDTPCPFNGGKGRLADRWCGAACWIQVSPSLSLSIPFSRLFFLAFKLFLAFSFSMSRFSFLFPSHFVALFALRPSILFSPPLSPSPRSLCLPSLG